MNRSKPYSIRLTEQERAHLARAAGSRSLSSYIREQILGDRVEFSAHRLSRAPRKCSVDQKAVARALAVLGQSRIASNLNQIAKAANIGALPVTPDLTQELHQACADIRAMRAELVRALGLKDSDA